MDVPDTSTTKGKDVRAWYSRFIANITYLPSTYINTTLDQQGLILFAKEKEEL
jgi:hypothetical protein